MEWRSDMENAPRDGTAIWLRSPSHEPDTPFYWSDDEGRWECILFATVCAYIGWWDENAEQPTQWRTSGTAA